MSAVATPNWIDLSTSDLAAGSAFYAELLGWTIESAETPLGEYHIASARRGETAGMMALPPDMAGGPSYWTVFFAVRDVDAISAKVTKAGGSALHPPIDLPDGTRIIAMTDATGAMFGLMSGAPIDRPYLSQEPGAVGWVELMTRSPDQANQFYAAVFDWSAAAEPTGNNVIYTVYSAGEQQLAGMIETPSHLPAEVPDNWSIYLTVADCAATEAKAVALGGAVIMASTPTPMGPFAVLADPQGAVFQIMEFNTAA